METPDEIEARMNTLDASIETLLGEYDEKIEGLKKRETELLAELENVKACAGKLRDNQKELKWMGMSCLRYNLREARALQEAKKGQWKKRSAEALSNAKEELEYATEKVDDLRKKLRDD
jgi:hypothetical protein